jgi:hypothetical protein
MDQTQRFDALMKVADFWTGRHDTRRDFEWKVTLGLWAVILGGISYHEKLGWPRLVCMPVFPVVSAAVFLLYWRGWLRPLWVRNAQDRSQAFNAVEEAKKVLLDESHSPKLLKHTDIDTSWHLFITDWSMSFQSVATIILLVLFCCITRP